MRGLSRPEQLALHLEENAAAWAEISGDVDPRTIGIFGRLEAIARALGRVQRQALAPYRINHAEFTTIGMLRTSPPDFRRSPTELRKLVGQSSAGMARILGKLEEEGLVRREAQADDGRRIDVILTRRGSALAEEAFPALLAAQSRVLALLGKSKRDDLLHVLDELLALFTSQRPA